MSTLIRIDQVPASDRFGFVQELVATTWLPMECESEHRADYRGQIRASGLGAMQVAVLDVMPITVRRTPALIDQADPDLLKMLLVCGGGRSVVDQGGQQACLSAAEFAFYDTRRPYEVTCGIDRGRPARVLTFMFSPSLLPLSPSLRRRLSAVRIPATAGVGELAAQFLLQLARNVDHYSPAAVAAAHHVSLRYLQQLFHDEGLTVAGWIRQRRLERCRRDLSDPALASRPVAAIAAGWGFASANDFSRAFRAAHGLPPSEYRDHARVVKDSAR